MLVPPTQLPTVPTSRSMTPSSTGRPMPWTFLDYDDDDDTAEKLNIIVVAAKQESRLRSSASVSFLFFFAFLELDWDQSPCGRCSDQVAWIGGPFSACFSAVAAPPVTFPRPHSSNSDRDGFVANGQKNQEPSGCKTPPPSMPDPISSGVGRSFLPGWQPHTTR